MATKQEIIDRLSQCGGLSYQDWIRLLDSIYFDGEIGDVYLPTTSNILPQNENSYTTFSIITEGTYTQSNGSPIVVPEGYLAIISNSNGIWVNNGSVYIKGEKGDDGTTVKTLVSRNKVSKSIISYGAYRPDGTIGSASTKTLLCVEVPVTSGMWYGIDGVNSAVIPSPWVRSVFVDNTNTAISSVARTQSLPYKVQAPANASKLSVTIAYDVATIPDLINNIYSESFQIVELISQSEPIPPYSSPDITLIDSEYLGNLGEKLEQEKVIQDLEGKTDDLLNAFDVAYKYNGLTSLTELGQDYVLSNIGDYVEIEYKLNSDWVNNSHSLGTLGKGVTSSTNVFGLGATNSMWLRTNTANMTYLQFAVSEDVYKLQKYKLIINSDGKWELFINGVSKGVHDKTSDLIIAQIAGAYSTKARITVKDFKIKIGEFTTQIDDLSIFSGSVDVRRDIKIDINGGDTPTSNYLQKSFYSFDTSGYLGNGAFSVYIKKEGNTNIYTRYLIGRQTDLSPIVYVDLYRIINAVDYMFSDGIMTPYGKNVLITGENEFTMKVNGKIDHTGGVHGDEIMESFKFLADGKEISLANNIPLTACDTFEYLVSSTLHETANTENPTTPIEGNPIIANHYKHTIFKNSGYTTKNKIKNISGNNISIERLYIGILCISKDCATSGNDEELTFVEFNGDGSQDIKKYGVREFFSYNGNYSSHATSKMIRRMLSGNTLVNYDNSYLFINDRTTDSKYYNCIVGVEIVNNEIWEFECKFKAYTIDVLS